MDVGAGNRETKDNFEVSGWSKWVNSASFIEWSSLEERDYSSGRHIKNSVLGACLVAQWLRICLPVQGTGVQSLVREDPTCLGATKPVSHNS